MGLCKCPKKKVTNLFCFEHRVNVCEHCLVANHSKCIVQSYLQWLQDSDYDPSCRLCGKNLADDANKQCVRLTCYDVFHWSCLDEFACKLPPNTAPAGYTCPTCNAGLFPGANAASPVVDSLKELLSTVNWARAGLGLPMIAESPRPVSNGMAVNAAGPTAVHTPSTSSRPAQDGGSNYRPPQSVVQPVQSVISMDEAVPYTRGVDRSEVLNNFQKIVSGIQDDFDNMNTSDHDTDKYKRRPALQWFYRWFSSRTTSGHMKRDPNAGVKRFFVIALLVLIGFVTIVIVFTRLGRSMTDSDPFLDPMANPNIRVQEDAAVDAK